MTIISFRPAATFRFLPRLVLWAACLLTGGIQAAPSPGPSDPTVLLAFREDADVLRLQLDTPVGALGNVTLANAGRPAVRIELKGLSSQRVADMVKSLQRPGKIKTLSVLPGLNGNVLIEAELTVPMKVLDETVVALGGNRSRWELVLGEGDGGLPMAADTAAAPALGAIRFAGSDDRLDMVLEGSAALVAEVSFEDAPARMVVELPGVPRAQLEQAVATLDALPPLLKRVGAVAPAGKTPGKLVLELRGGVDLVDTGGVARDGVGQVTMSLVADSLPSGRPAVRQQALKAIDTQSMGGEVGIVLEGPGDARVNAYTLTQPSRVVVDFLGWTPSQVKQAVGRFSTKDPVVRQAALTETRLGSARVVFDVVTPVALGSRRYPQLADGADGKLVLALRAPAASEADTRMAGASGLAMAAGRDLRDLRKPEVVIKPVQLDGMHAEGREAASSPGARYDLVAMLERAMQADAKYAIARADYEAVSEAVPQARAGFLPVASFDYQRSRVHQNVRQSPNPTFLKDSVTYPSQSMTLTITQPLLRVQSWMREDQAQVSVEQARLNLLAAEQDLILRVTTGYLNLLATTDGLELAKSEREATGKQLDLARSRLQSGLGTITQLHETTARQALTEAKVIEAGNRVDDARLALKEMVGENVDSVSGFRRDFIAAPPRPANAESWVQAALEQNLALQARRLSLDIAQLEIKRQRAGHLPTVDLVGTAGRQDAEGSLYGAGQKVDTGELAFKVHVPLFEGGLTSSMVREAVARSGKADRESEQETRRTERATRSAFLGVQASVQTLDALRQTVLAQESALESKLEGYRAGLQTTVAVVDAYRLYFAARRDYLQARYDYLSNRLKLKQAVGTLARGDLQDLAALLE
jgi:outer membrane protein